MSKPVKLEVGDSFLLRGTPPRLRDIDDSRFTVTEVLSTGTYVATCGSVTFSYKWLPSGAYIESPNDPHSHDAIDWDTVRRAERDEAQDEDDFLTWEAAT